MVQVQAQSGTYARNTTYTILRCHGRSKRRLLRRHQQLRLPDPVVVLRRQQRLFVAVPEPRCLRRGRADAQPVRCRQVLDRVNATATGDLNNVLNALSLLSNTQGPAALNAISGEPYADFGTMNVNNAAMFMNALGQQMGNARGAASTGQRQALAQACEIESCDAVGPLSAWPVRWVVWAACWVTPMPRR